MSTNMVTSLLQQLWMCHQTASVTLATTRHQLPSCAVSVCTAACVQEAERVIKRNVTRVCYSGMLSHQIVANLVRVGVGPLA